MKPVPLELYCHTCGHKLTVKEEEYNDGYNSSTGEVITIYLALYHCPNKKWWELTHPDLLYKYRTSWTLG